MVAVIARSPTRPRSKGNVLFWATPPLFSPQAGRGKKNQGRKFHFLVFFFFLAFVSLILNFQKL